VKLRQQARGWCSALEGVAVEKNNQNETYKKHEEERV
jgi:hypothetical protein